jgi:hypothetical protein
MKYKFTGKRRIRLIFCTSFSRAVASSCRSLQEGASVACYYASHATHLYFILRFYFLTRFYVRPAHHYF